MKRAFTPTDPFMLLIAAESMFEALSPVPFLLAWFCIIAGFILSLAAIGCACFRRTIRRSQLLALITIGLSLYPTVFAAALAMMDPHRGASPLWKAVWFPLLPAAIALAAMAISSKRRHPAKS